MMYRYLGSAAVLVTAAILLAGCSAGADTGSGSSTEIGGTITLWSYGEETQSNKDLVAGFEKKYPGTTVKVVEQPGDNYFALLQASVTSGKAPDAFLMFPGGYQQQFADYSLDLSKYINRTDLESVNAQFFAKDSNLDNPVYGVPTVSNMYYTLYNQDVLDAAGVATFPTDWAELNDACKKITAAGYLCLGYGNTTGSGGFSAYQDFSYMSGQAVGLAGWDGLLAGTESYTQPAILDQVEQWASLETKGYTNEDVMTWRDVRTDFLAGKTAMMVTGSWDAQWAVDGLGDAVHGAPAPFSDDPIDVLIRLQDAGISVSVDSKNPATAAAYAAYNISDEGQKIIAAAGGVPARTGVGSSNRVNQEILANAEAAGWTQMPMYDNFIAPSVNEALNSGLNQVLAGQLSAKDALGKVDAATKALTDAERINYNLSGK